MVNLIDFADFDGDGASAQMPLCAAYIWIHAIM